MHNELTYDAWMTEGNKYKQKYYMLQSIGLMLWAAGCAYVVMGLKLSILAGLMIGFIPYFVFYLAGMAMYEKWQNCEDKYNHHVPFIDVKKMNVPLAALEFEPETVTAHYMQFDGTMQSIALPANKIEMLPAEDDLDSMQLRKDTNNFNNTEEWVYIRIYLTPKMQKKMLSLVRPQ